MTSSSLRPTAPASWRRPTSGSLLAGVCSPVAANLGVPLTALRIIFAIGGAISALLIFPTLNNGITSWQGIALSLFGAPLVVSYAVLWFSLPQAEPSGGPDSPFGAAMDEVLTPRVTRGLDSLLRWFLLSTLTGFTASLILLCWVIPILVTLEVVPWLPPLNTGDMRVLTAVGAGVLIFGMMMGLLPLETFSQLRGRPGSATMSLGRAARVAIWLAVVAMSMAAVGTLFFLSGRRGAIPGLVVGSAVFVVGAGVAIPWIRRVVSFMRVESEERARAEQKAEIAAHLHDSVLQTLTLLQRDGIEVTDVHRLARRQERELRRWLYGADENAGAVTVRNAIEDVVAEVEDSTGRRIDTVIVGDAEQASWARPLLLALREATLNATKHSNDDVSVYAEVSNSHLEVFIRDHGPGFAIDDIPPDRLGVRQSILGRMHRAGGTARYLPAPGGGTEVSLSLTSEELS